MKTPLAHRIENRLLVELSLRRLSYQLHLPHTVPYLYLRRRRRPIRPTKNRHSTRIFTSLSTHRWAVSEWASSFIRVGPNMRLQTKRNRMISSLLYQQSSKVKTVSFSIDLARSMWWMLLSTTYLIFGYLYDWKGYWKNRKQSALVGLPGLSKWILKT